MTDYHGNMTIDRQVVEENWDLIEKWMTDYPMITSGAIVAKLKNETGVTTKESSVRNAAAVRGYVRGWIRRYPSVTPK